MLWKSIISLCAVVAVTAAPVKFEERQGLPIPIPVPSLPIPIPSASFPIPIPSASFPIPVPGAGPTPPA
ncbi:hypothetical protein CPB86DRAFT_786401 [Serendipita vermifera]|nr:hypothetical protein CPB86DRAFT_786401 [Serendipita vermifera]